jgi:hypothetical protein
MFRNAVTVDTVCLKYIAFLTWPQPPILFFFYSNLVHFPKLFAVALATFLTDYAVANITVIPIRTCPIVTRKISMVTATFFAAFAEIH